MFVAPQSLYGGIIDYFDRTLKRGFKVEPGPPKSKVIRFGNRTISDDRSGIANRYRVILPILGKLFDARDHLFGGQLGTRCKFTKLLLSCSENLHVSSAYVDDQHIHRALHVFSRSSQGLRSWKRLRP